MNELPPTASFPPLSISPEKIGFIVAKARVPHSSNRGANLRALAKWLNAMLLQFDTYASADRKQLFSDSQGSRL